MTMLDPIKTTVAAIPIPNPFMALVVTASVGQVPSISRSTGFSLIIPFEKTVESFSFSMVTYPPLQKRRTVPML